MDTFEDKKQLILDYLQVIKERDPKRKFDISHIGHRGIYVTANRVSADIRPQSASTSVSSSEGQCFESEDMTLAIASAMRMISGTLTPFVGKCLQGISDIGGKNASYKGFCLDGIDLLFTADFPLNGTVAIVVTVTNYLYDYTYHGLGRVYRITNPDIRFETQGSLLGYLYEYPAFNAVFETP